MRKLTKIWGIRLAAIALVLVVGTAFAVATTYSKYVKSAGEPAQNVSVADFGVSMTKDGYLFKEEYTAATPNVKNSAGDDITISVDANSNTFAPGTDNGTGMVLTTELDGSNEVAVNVAFALSAADVTGWALKDDTEYEPVKFTIAKSVKVGDAEAVVTYYDGDTWESTSSTITASQIETVADSVNYPANSTVTTTYTITWAWTFDGTINDNSQYVCTTAVEGYAVGDVIASGAYAGLDSAIKAGFTSCGTSADAADTYIGSIGTAAMTITANMTATQID